MFSTADRLAPYELEAGSHVHAAWAFTAAGTYRFTFRTSAELADGTQVHAEETYTVVVGEVPQDIFEQGHRAHNPQDSAESAAAPPQREEAASRRIGMLPRMSAHQREITARVVLTRSIR